MALEVRFTPKGREVEIPFTVVEDKDGTLYLFANYNDEPIKIKLKNQDGSLSLDDPSYSFVEDDKIVKERLIGLSSDWLEFKDQGFEGETTEGSGLGADRPGYGPDDIFVENKPFSLAQIVDLIKMGDIDLSPDFQRNFIWDQTRQSRLIESIFLGLPLPSIYLSQYDDGRLTIVDGLQRLTTIKEFMEDRLTLSNLEYLQNCNGKKYSQLESTLSRLMTRRFSQTQIMCFVIDYRSPSKLKFDLFRRLNTGGKPLNNQEIRNCLSRPEVQTVLREIVRSGEYLRATDWSVKDTRMEAQESVLRFMYFYDQYSEENPLGAYDGYMDKTLDDFVDYLNKQQDIGRYGEVYKNALRCAYHLFGRHTFRKVYPSTIDGRRTPINKLLMLTVSVLLSKYDAEKIENGLPAEHLVVPLSELIENPQSSTLFNAITWSTNSKWNIKTTYEILKKELFDKHLGAAYEK